MKQKKTVKERNQLVALALFRKAGSHTKTNKSKRRQENMKMRSSGVEHHVDIVKVEISKFFASTI
jgi:hypothetical protein